jgi:multidrug efflux pump subunit AcrA (membrane-fusion protein)
VGFEQLDPRILPDMAVRVGFRASETEPPVVGVLVPQAALVSDSGSDTVWVVADGRARKRKVTKASLLNEEVTLSDGLKPGEKVVVEGGAKLREGARVRERQS